MVCGRAPRPQHLKTDILSIRVFFHWWYCVLNLKFFFFQNSYSKLNNLRSHLQMWVRLREV